MKGMSNATGGYLDDLDHLKQSIYDILSTPIGSRVISRDYGSNLYKLVDEPINQYLFPKIYAAVAEALEKWEPRIKVEKVTIVSVEQGKISLNIEANYLMTQQKFNSVVSI